MNTKIYMSVLFLFTSIVYAQKEVNMSDLLNNTYEVEDVYIYNHTCICKTCKKVDFICTKLDDSPFLALSGWLKQNPDTRVIFRVFIDSHAAEKYGANYTEQKAKALSDILIEFGVGANQFTSKGMGVSPRTLTYDINGKNSGYLFKAGSVINEAFLNNILTSVGYQEYEDAHLLNRRIEMKIIAK
jgi:hypothetical protein